MAVIYLRHPVHGEKVESSDLIAAMDRANGWVDFDPSPVQAVVPDFLAPSPEPVVEAPKVKRPKP